jgi:hypothetical protein
MEVAVDASVQCITADNLGQGDYGAPRPPWNGGISVYSVSEGRALLDNSRLTSGNTFVLDPAEISTTTTTTVSTTVSSLATAHATGDPHLQNIYGERFDLMRPGKVVLVHIPRGHPVERALLIVEADAIRLGGQCADMYFQKVNVTGAWADKARAGGLRFDANLARDEHPKWVKLGPVELKVAHGRTNTGVLYLNFFIKHLKFAAFDIGGVLGADDHTAEDTPTDDCQKQLAVFSKSWQKSVTKSVASAALG